MSDADRRREIDVAILGEAMISDEGVSVLRTLCDVHGSRFAGSAQERGAGEFLLERMGAIGLSHVHAEPFRILGWRRGAQPRIRAVSPTNAEVEAIALPYCPATRKGGIELEVLSLGEGLPEDFARMARVVKGKAVLVTSESPAYYPRWVHRAEKYARAVALGAKAFLFMNHYDGLLAPTGALRFNHRAEIPGLGLAKETGLALLRLANGGPLRLHIETFDQTLHLQSRNLVGEFEGSERADEFVVVGGHYDGHDISQGADDNAGGAATVIEAARLLAPHRAALKRTVRFVCFGSEEIGLLGGHQYVRAHAKELPRTRLMVNVDCVGGARGKGFDFHGWEEAKEPLGKMAGEMHEAVGFGCRPNPYSDHFPFLIAGVPNCALGNVGGAPAGRGYGHTAADTVDKVNRADLREAAALLARSLIRFANDPAWALPHKARRQVRQMLDRFEIISVLRTEGNLPPELR